MGEPTVGFTLEQKQVIARKIQTYFREELDQEIGNFDAQFLLDFFTEEIGPLYYNQGLYDALAVFETQVDTIADAVYSIEKPTTFR